MTEFFVKFLQITQEIKWYNLLHCRLRPSHYFYVFAFLAVSFFHYTSSTLELFTFVLFRSALQAKKKNKKIEERNVSSCHRLHIWCPIVEMML